MVTNQVLLLWILAGYSYIGYSKVDLIVITTRRRYVEFLRIAFLLRQALMKQFGEKEWRELSEKDRQQKIMEMKLRERKLRQAGKLDEAAALMSSLIKSEEGSPFNTSRIFSLDAVSSSTCI